MAAISFVHWRQRSLLSSSSNILQTTMKRILPILIILSVLGVALGSAWYLKRSSSANPNPATDTPRPSTPALVAPGANPPNTIGPANAPISIEEFGDFECPPCGQF